MKQTRLISTIALAIAVSLSNSASVLADSGDAESLPSCRDIGVSYRTIRTKCNTVVYGRTEADMEKWVREHGGDPDSCEEGDAVCREEQTDLAQKNCVKTEFKCQ